jgi:lipopolysaccharide export system permease protein
MRILTRYILRLHVAPFIFAVIGLTVLLLLDQVSRQFEDLIGKDLHWSVIAEVFVYSIPFILAQTLPMAVLIAVLYTFNRLAGDHEITAVKASGIPMFRLMAPLLLAATVVAGGMTWFNNTILPDSNHHLQVLLTSIGRKKPTFYLRERTINEVLPSRLYVQPGAIQRERSALEDVVIYDERGGQKSRTIYADSGRMAFGAEGEDLYLTLLDGTLQERPNDSPHTFQRIHFSNLVMRVEGVTNQLERDTLGAYRSDREMNIQDMHEEVLDGMAQVEAARTESRIYAVALARRLTDYRVPLEDAAGDPLPDDAPSGAAEPDSTAVRAPPTEGSIRAPDARDAAAIDPEDAALPQNLKDAGRRARGDADRFHNAIDGSNQFISYRDRALRGLAQANKYWVEIHKKGSIPAACIVFVLIGAPIAVRYPRAGVALVVGVSLAFFGAYYVSLVGGEELADRRFISPLWAMWAPNVLFGIIGAWLVFRARRVSG